MKREAALNRLSDAYARALRLADAGSSDLEIARGLGIDVASVRPLLAIGREKLARLMTEDLGDGSDGTGENPGDDGSDGSP